MGVEIRVFSGKKSDLRKKTAPVCISGAILKKYRILYLWPRQESNLDPELRKLIYYPLYYEAGFIISNFECRMTNKNQRHHSSFVIRYSSFVIIYHLPNFTILLPKILTAIANNITPKNFLITAIPLGPTTFSIHFNDLSTI